MTENGLEGSILFGTVRQYKAVCYGMDCQSIVLYGKLRYGCNAEKLPRMA